MQIQPPPPTTTPAPHAHPGTGEPDTREPGPSTDSPPSYTPTLPTNSATYSTTSAPVLTNLADGETVTQRVLLVQGRAGPLRGETTITVYSPEFPNVSWPVVDSYFKTLVHLQPGPNAIMFAYRMPGYPPDAPPFVTVVRVAYVPLLQNPPLYLAILVAADSQLTFDVPPEKKSENTIEVASRKLRMAGYMWQAFCAEQMYRNGFGRRTFRLSESWQPDTLSRSDPPTVLRHTAQIYLIRTSRTLAELRDPSIAQQNPDRDESKPDLFAFFLDALRDHGAPFNRPCHVAGLVLDTMWDPEIKLIRGHAALGGGAGHIALGIFGSHSLHAWPAAFEDVQGCLTDATKTDTKFVADDAGESGEWWKAANIGMGAMLHEVGHAHTLTHTATGIMSRGFNNWNRAFMVKEPHFNGPVRPHDEAGAHWHRIDTLRLRFHPSFRLPLDPSRSPHIDYTPTFIPLDSGLEIHAAAGLVMVEFELDGRYKTHIEFPNQNGQPTRLPFSEDDLWRRVGVKPGSGRLRIEATASNTHSAAIDDVTAFFKDRVVTIPGGKCIKSAPAGHRGLNGAETIVPFPPQGPRLTKICVHHGDFLDGIVFGFANGTTNIIGTQGGGVTELELAPDEKIEKITLRSGAWIDGLEIHTTKGRSTGWCGGRGGGPGSLAPPDRYELVGMWGTAKNWVDSVGILYRKREARVGVAEGKGGDGREGV